MIRTLHNCVADAVDEAHRYVDADRLDLTGFDTAGPQIRGEGLGGGGFLARSEVDLPPPRPILVRSGEDRDAGVTFGAGGPNGVPAVGLRRGRPRRAPRLYSWRLHRDLT
jgi:hypothetical protein